MSEYEVRAIEKGDYEWLINVAATRMLVEEVKAPELVDPPSLHLLLDKMRIDGTALVALVDGEYAGAIAGVIHPNMLNLQITTMTEVMWYVLPEYRGTRAGYLLLKAYDKMTQESPAHYGTMSLLDGSPVLIKSIEKQGFRSIERSFRKDYKEM